MSPLGRTVKLTRSLAAELTGHGHRVSADTVGDLLREEGFSLQARRQTLEGRQHPDRDAQFRCINERTKGHISAGLPVISVDMKKEELVGDYKNAGRQWRPSGEPAWSRRTTSWTGRDRARPSPTGSMASPRTPAG